MGLMPHWLKIILVQKNLMFINFKSITSLVSFLCFGLSLSLLTIPFVFAWLFQIDQTISSDFMGRRAAMLFLGFGVLTALTRKSRIRETQNVVAMAICVAMAGLAVLGLYEFTVGNAGLGIFLAIMTEILICGLYWSLLRAVK
jgi:hypothetical protein